MRWPHPRAQAVRRACPHLTADDPVLSALVEPLLNIIVTMTRELARLTRQVLDIVRDEPVCRHLMTAQGVGPLTALAFRATTDRPERFRRLRDVGAHLGLTPRRHQSGKTDVAGHVRRCGDELTRTALYEATNTLLVRSQKWSALRAWGMKVAKARGMARARVAVARKLAVILHRIGVTTRTSAGASKPRPRRKEAFSASAHTGGATSSRGDEGRGDLVESPEPRGNRPEGRDTD